MTWDILLERPGLCIRRRGRFLVADLLSPSRVVSTSVENGGQSSGVRYLLNHQSCEGAGHLDLHRVIAEIGHSGYHRRVCGEASLPPEATAMMGTAANMHYAVVTTERDLALNVTAVVTAGVQSNATCAGDPARWRETAAGFEKVSPYAGTINTMLIVDTPMTDAALARAIAIMTEGKSAALQRLAVPSRQSADLATGTGTDQYCVAAPVALRWQNGLEPSYTRGLFHALGRYGVDEATFVDDIAPLLAAGDLELLRRNTKGVAYEPLVGAAAHALAVVLDRTRHGTLPASVERDAAIQLAATLAVNVAARPERWCDFRARLHQDPWRDTKSLILAAVALGWSEKWVAR